MGLLQRLFNTCPKPAAKAITDQQGYKYWIVWDDDAKTPRVYLYHYGRVIGQVSLIWADSELHLADVNILNSQHRGKGIGSALLQEVIVYARKQNARIISGWVAAHDAEENPNLFDWYRRRGFQVVLERDGISVAKLYLVL